jgi:hypothetical protein
MKYIEWFYPEEIPTEKSFDFKVFSVEILIYFPDKKSHAIGWYHYPVQEWFLLTSEKYKINFAWRYFKNDIDKLLQKNSENDKWLYPKEFPDELKVDNDNESVEVLIYVYQKKHHAVGYYNYLEEKWKSVFNNEELHYEFAWRYFEIQLDEI